MPTHPVAEPAVRLEIDAEALSAVTFALQRTIDDLEARALVATDQDPDLGPPSAAEYRADIDRLAGLLSQLGRPAVAPDPEQAAVIWFDGVYTIEAGRPQRMTATVRLSRLLADAIEARRDGRLTPNVLIELVAEATGTSMVDTAEQLRVARQIARRTDRQPERASSRHLAGPDTTSR